MNYTKIANCAANELLQARALVALHSTARTIVRSANPKPAELTWAKRVRRSSVAGAPLSNVVLMAIAATPTLLAELDDNGDLAAGSTEDDLATVLQSAVNTVVVEDLAPYENDS